MRMEEIVNSHGHYNNSHVDVLTMIGGNGVGRIGGLGGNNMGGNSIGNNGGNNMDGNSIGNNGGNNMGVGVQSGDAPTSEVLSRFRYLSEQKNEMKRQLKEFDEKFEAERGRLLVLLSLRYFEIMHVCMYVCIIVLYTNELDE